jgi:hypothetical protein
VSWHPLPETAAKWRIADAVFHCPAWPQSGAKLNFATGLLWRGAVLFASKSNGSFCSQSSELPPAKGIFCRLAPTPDLNPKKRRW